jgi:hypothetical protein
MHKSQPGVMSGQNKGPQGTSLFLIGKRQTAFYGESLFTPGFQAYLSYLQQAGEAWR